MKAANGPHDAGKAKLAQAEYKYRIDPAERRAVHPRGHGRMSLPCGWRRGPTDSVPLTDEPQDPAGCWWCDVEPGIGR